VFHKKTVSLRQITEQISAKLPNESAPNYRTNQRQITEFLNITLNINHL
jgi:hypothetical protein